MKTDRSTSRRNGRLGLALTVSVLLIATAVVAAADPAEPPDPGRASGRVVSSEPGRLEWATALRALEEGRPHIAGIVLRELLPRTEGADREACEAFLALAEGRLAEGRERVSALLEETAPGDLSWPEIHEHLLARAAAARLADRERAAEAALADLLARHDEARGGLAALEALTDLVAEGRLITADGAAEFRLARKRPRLYRFDLATVGGRRVDVTDGETAWRYNATTGVEEALLPAEARTLLRESSFDDLLVRARHSGEEMLYAGIDERDGVPAHRIEVRADDGAWQTVFLDPKTLLEVERRIRERPDRPATTVRTRWKTVGGIVLPAVQVVERDGASVVFEFQRYETGKTIDPSHFTRPERPDEPPPARAPGSQ